MAYTVNEITEPLTLTEVKSYLHLNPDNAEDLFLETLIGAAREFCENRTGRTLTIQDREYYPTEFALIMALPNPPIISVESIEYTDKDGVTQTMSKANYIVDSVDGEIALFDIPKFEPQIVNPIKISYKAGYTTLPKMIKEAMYLLIGHWYTNRTAVIAGNAAASREVELAATTLLNQYKVWWY